MSDGKLSNGNFTLSELEDMNEVIKVMKENDIHPNAAEYIKYTSLPKGHPEYLTQAEAAKKYFPEVSAPTAKVRVLNAYMQFWRVLFFGTELEHYQQLYEARYLKPEHEKKKRGRKHKLPLEERAKILETRKNEIK